jgi:hypothetical protein
MWRVLTSGCTGRVHDVVQNCLVKIILDTSLYSLLFHNRGRIHVLWNLKLTQFWGLLLEEEYNVTNTELGTKMNMYSGPLPGSWKGSVQVRSFAVNPHPFVLIYSVHHQKIWLHCIFYCFFFREPISVGSCKKWKENYDPEIFKMWEKLVVVYVKNFVLSICLDRLGKAKKTSGS